MSAWDWFIQSDIRSWAVVSLVIWALLGWLRTSDLRQRMETAEALFLSEQRKLRHLENEHVRLERRVFAVIPSDDALNASDGGPYRSADHVPDAGQMVDDEPVFKTGDDVDVCHDRGPWFRAKMLGFSRLSSGTIVVRLESAGTDMYPLNDVDMRHARTS